MRGESFTRPKVKSNGIIEQHSSAGRRNAPANSIQKKPFFLVRTPPAMLSLILILFLTIRLGSDSHLPNHAHFVMEGADVREDSRVWESDAETYHAEGCLWQRSEERRVGKECR